MTAAAFDTLKAARELEAAGFTREQAEAATNALSASTVICGGVFGLFDGRDAALG